MSLPGRGGVFPTMTSMGRLCQIGLPFSGFKYNIRTEILQGYACGRVGRSFV